MTPEAKTPLSPEPDWIETLRQLGSADYVVIDPLWPLLCDVAEQAERWSTFIPALAALRDEVERDA